MVIPFSFNNGVHGVFSIKAEARTIETGHGRSAMLTLTFCGADGGGLGTQDLYFGAKAENNAYDLEHAIATISEHHMECVA